MAFVCSLSGEIPREPAISLISKRVFERCILEKFVRANQMDPITNESMTLEHIVVINNIIGDIPPHPGNTSIPAMLRALQDEWDSFVLYNYNRHVKAKKCEQELSSCMVQLDASCRVIARLAKDNDELKRKISQIGSHFPQMQTDEKIINNTTKMDIEPDQITAAQLIPQSIQDEIKNLAFDLTSQRKKRNKTLPKDLTNPDDISSFKNTYTNTNLHSASVPGILAMDLRLDDGLIVTGGNDKMATVLDASSDKILTTLKGHTKKVTRAIFHPTEQVVITGAADAQVRIWDQNVPKAKRVMKYHNAEISGVSLHPLGNFILTTAYDKSWAFTDYIANKCVVRRYITDDLKITCNKIHPDGVIFCTGMSDGLITVWDFKTCMNVSLLEGHTASATDISFSENGYYLATSSLDSTVRIWDLRKSVCSLTLDFDPNTPPNCVQFDPCGQYLAIGVGNDISVFSCKKWTEMVTFKDHEAPVTSVKFGHNCKCIASASLDRSLHLYTY